MTSDQLSRYVILITIKCLFVGNSTVTLCDFTNDHVFSNYSGVFVERGSGRIQIQNADIFDLHHGAIQTINIPNKQQPSRVPNKSLKAYNYTKPNKPSSIQSPNQHSHMVRQQNNHNYNPNDQHKHSVRINQHHYNRNKRNHRHKQQKYNHRNSTSFLSSKSKYIPQPAPDQFGQTQSVPQQQKSKYHHTQQKLTKKRNAAKYKSNQKNMMHISRLITRRFKRISRDNGRIVISKEHSVKRKDDTFYQGYLYQIEIKNDPNKCPIGFFMPCEIPDHCLQQIHFPVWTIHVILVIFINSIFFSLNTDPNSQEL